MSNDRELLEAWRKGENAAGEALVARYFDTFYGFFRRKVDADVADLVQTTFLKIVQSKTAFHGDSSVRTYLFAVARNVLYDHLRTRYRVPDIDFSISSVRDLGPSPSSLIDRKDEVARLVGAIERLPLELQLIVELHYWEDLSGPDLALVLDLPEGTVRSRLRRALEQLRVLVAESGAAHRPECSSVEALEAWARSMNPYLTGHSARRMHD